MGTVLIYDWDYFHYPGVIPNLECAKLAAYEKSKRNITVFMPKLEPTMYTKTYIRKEYDDGIYSKEFQLPNVSYGGRAFSATYKSLGSNIEDITPDFSIYENYKNLYGTTKSQLAQISSIVNGTNVRLSVDGKNLQFPFDRLRLKYPSVILHDYDIAALPNVYELLEEICNSGAKRPYRIGNKYPINIYSYEELIKWLNITPMAELFYLQYNGVFTDEQLINLVENHRSFTSKIMYNFTYNCRDETEFMMQVLPIFYKQALFLRSSNQKILLNIDEDFFKTKELLNLMKAIKSYSNYKIREDSQARQQTFFAYCKSEKAIKLQSKPWYKSVITRENMINSFQYMREHNYEVFDMFYSIPLIVARGGKLVNEYE